MTAPQRLLEPRKTLPDGSMRADYEPGLVSVIIPTYNRAHLLIQAMDSVWVQTYRPIELIVADDGSTDNTASAVECWCLEHAGLDGFRTRYLRQPNTNRGAPAARNLGLREARGKYVRFLDSDDYLFPEATARQVARLQETAAEVCYGDWEEQRGDVGQLSQREGVFSAGEMSDPVAALLGKKWCPNFSYLLLRDAAIQTGGWNEQYEALQDRDFILRIAYCGARFVRCDCLTGCYYQHSMYRVSRNDEDRWRRFMKKVICDGIAWLNENRGWTEDRRQAVAHSLFVHARRYYRVDRDQFLECLRLMEDVCPKFRPPGWAYPLVARLVGYESAESIRRTARKLLRRA